jgi:hypothetical protein
MFQLIATGVMTSVVNLPPVSLILVVHLGSRISPRIFRKILNNPNAIFNGLGEDGKSLKQKIS